MNIEKARQLKPGDIVHYPNEADGKGAFTGFVTYIAPGEQANYAGVPYLWVHVRNKSLGFDTVWPSNRLC